MAETVGRFGDNQAPPLLTFRDAVQHVVEYARGNASAANSEAARDAVLRSYREIPSLHPWRFLTRECHLNLSADYATGTVEYDHTGGTYERQLTLTTGTWPTWAAYGIVRIDDVSYPVATRESNSVVTLDPTVNPGADIAAGTSFTIYRSQYTLPSWFVGLAGEPQTGNEHYSLSGMDAGEFHRLDRWTLTVGQPWRYALLGDDSLLGSMAIAFWPTPDTADTVQFMAHCRPRPLRITGLSAADYQGSASTTSGSASGTGSGTAFAASMVGAVIRYSSNTTDLPEGLASLNPYAEERTIKAVASTTAITLDAAASATRSGVKYIVSDPIDLPEYMQEAFLALCRWKYGQIKRDQTQAKLQQDFIWHLRVAKEADAMTASIRRPSVAIGTDLGFFTVTPGAEIG